MVGLRDDPTAEFRLRSGAVVRAWGGTTVEHVTNVVSEVMVQDVYRIKDSEEPTVVIDVGAHIGTFAIMIGRRFPSARVICLEPMDDSFGFCLENVEANGLS